MDYLYRFNFSVKKILPSIPILMRIIEHIEDIIGDFEQAFAKVGEPASG